MAGRQEIGGDWKLPDTFDFKDEQVRFGTLGEGSPLVLLHGTPFSSVVWRRIAPWLANHRRVFYFDLLGYGRSEKHDGHDVSLGIQNEVLTALLEGSMNACQEPALRVRNTRRATDDLQRPRHGQVAGLRRPS
jgi:pimeloyl-ACP methyl ester carboxylesterase